MLRIAQEALTFDDVLLLPSYSEVLPKSVSLRSQLTRAISLNIPLVSAAMDTVTEARLAINMAQEGGMGIIHKNMTPKQQATEAHKVKRHESGVVRDPVTIDISATLGELLQLRRRHSISGVPVLKDGVLAGIVTSRDVRFENDKKRPVTELMTARENLVTVTPEASKKKILQLLHRHRVEKLLVLDRRGMLCGMITAKDMNNTLEYPDACKDEAGRLRVGAAVGTGPDTQERVERLIDVGVDVIVVDTAHGHSRGVIEQVAWIKKHYPDTQVIGGNIATASAARALADAGVDGVKVGIGPGSICTTRIVTGIGVPQISALANVVAGLDGINIPVVADGGIRYSGDIAKAIVAGASSVMVGSMFAGTDEAPGELILYQGRSYKSYRGMGSLGAMAQSQGSSDRYFQSREQGADKLVPEGVEGRVPCRGPVGPIIHQLTGGLRAAMGYTGSADIQSMRTKPEFVKVTSAGMRESHVHDVSITKESPNYQTQR